MYESVLPSMATLKKQLVQTQVGTRTLRLLDALARAVGKSRSRYVGDLLTTHVRALPSAKLARALARSLPDPMRSSSGAPSSPPTRSRTRSR